MIQATELRLGNWVTCEGKAYQVNINILQSFTVSPVWMDVIPLTPELLQNAGFEMYHQNPRLEIFYTNNQSYYPFHIYESRDGRYYYNENLELKSLHKLQNLYFALTGDELEINLPVMSKSVI